MKKRIGLIIVLWLAMNTAQALNTAQITIASTGAAVNPECNNICLKGVCVKLICTLLGCHTITTPRISNRLPDLIVQSYNQNAEMPWVEMALLLKVPLETAEATALALAGSPFHGGGFRAVTSGSTTPNTEGASEQHANNLKFKHTSAIGNPAVQLAYATMKATYGGMACPSSTIPLRPYYQSELDTISWRYPIVEWLYPATWIPFKKEVGAITWPFPRTWGPIHPRHGFVNQDDDLKAGVVTALRAVDIVTRDMPQPHLYSRAPLNSSNLKSDKYQMLHPNTELTCTALGEGPELYANPFNQSPNTGYAWAYWSEHECCTGPGTTIAVIDTPDVCYE